MILDITSPANPKIKWLASLHKPAYRRETKLIIVEGGKEVSAALNGGLMLHSLFHAPELGTTIPTADRPALTISRACFEKVAYRKSSDGIIGVFHEPTISLKQASFGPHPFVIILEAVEKPGNLGAIIRTADGCGADAVIICDPRTDLWNPNTIRASLGTIFTTPVFAAPSSAVLAFLHTHHITPFAAALRDDALPYTEANFRQPVALVMGTEANGLSQFWLDAAQPIIIPMRGKNDSLNVSVATGVLAYEVIRQRA